MRHGYSLKKLNRTSAHRQSLLMNLAIALFKYEQVKTTLVKAKVLRPYAEKLITLARQDNLTNRRKLLGLLGDEAVVQKLLENVAPRFANRAGGYTRIYKVGFRYGDNAPMGLIELVLLDKEAMQKSRKSVTQKAKKEVTEAKKQNQSGSDDSVQEKVSQDKTALRKARDLDPKAPRAQKSISRKPTINKSLKGGG